MLCIKNQFILYLYGKKPPPLQMLRNPFIITPDVSHVGHFITSYFIFAFLHKPVRQSPISAFTMDPGADPQRYLQLFFMTEIDKFTQIPVPIPAEFIFCFFMMNPKYIGGNNT